MMEAKTFYVSNIFALSCDETEFSHLNKLSDRFVQMKKYNLNNLCIKRAYLIAKSKVVVDRFPASES